jgi:hypothetical protein
MDILTLKAPVAPAHGIHDGIKPVRPADHGSISSRY